MPRPSIASLSIVRPAAASAKLAPTTTAAAPKELSTAEVKLWRATVESKPIDWFGPDCWPVLKEYVRAAAMCDELAKAATKVMKKDDVTDMRRVLDLRDREAKRMADLATKLRLTSQSRYTPHAAATADRRASGKRPWQRK